jgi:adenosylcobinamide-GDP ribazoletransferase
MTAFLLALQFLTRVPVSPSYPVSDKQLGFSVLFYPVIGLLIGVAMTALSTLLSHASISVQAALLLSFWVLITGGLHLDGLADCADAWVGGLGNPQRSLEIMKDPAAGPIAVISLVLLLLLKWTVLAELLEKSQLSGLILAPLLGRCAILVLMLNTPYVRKDGLSTILIQHFPATAAKISLLGCVLLTTYSIGFLPLVFALLMVWWIRKLAMQRLGGVTGDVYGATVELVEASVLISLVIA